MKETLFYIFILSLACLNASAQDAFYYYRGEKVPLKVVEGKVAVRTALGVESRAVQNGLRVVHTQNDKRQQLAVCEYDAGNTSAKSMVSAKLASNSSSFMPCYTDDQGLEVWPTGYVSVKLKSADDVALLQNVAHENGLEVVEQDPFMPLWWLLQCGGNTSMPVIDVANRLQESGLFASASPDFACNGAEISYDPDVHKQWNLYNAQNEGFDINVSPAWNYATGRGVKIAIVDNYIDIKHKDLAANIDTTLCYNVDIKSMSEKSAFEVNDKSDNVSHGTHCAGIAAAVRNNGINGAGVAPEAKIMAINCGVYQGIYLARGINWAWQSGADVISCSWACAKDSLVAEALDNAVAYGRNGKGCVIVKSAGNKGKSDGRITWPGTYSDNVLAVAAMDINGRITQESSFGNSIFVAAPGDSIWSTLVNDGMGMMNGTSMAAPQVAGVAALILERNPKLTAEQVRTVIARSARKMGKDFRKNDEAFDYCVTKEYGLWNYYFGYGVVDAYNAVLLTPVY